MAKKKRSRDDDISMDLSGVKKVLEKANMEQVAMVVLIVAALALVFWIRMLPTSLPVTDQWAEQTVTQNLRLQFQQQVVAEFPSLPPENRDARVNERLEAFLAENGGQLEAAKEQFSTQIKQGLRYEGENGKQYTYLGDLDSYFWLRYTRNWLNTGITCDEVREDGKCMDMFTLAPVGSQGAFNPSAHVFAIGYLYKFITLFNDDFPLPATSFLVPVLIGMLGVIPAFFIGRRLAGNVGGAFAAVLISIHPLVLSRSMGSDNDIWNVVIPLFIMWMTIEALEAKEWKGQVIFGVLAGAISGVYVAFWTSWWFIYLVILLGLLADLGFQAARYIIRERSHKVWESLSVRTAFIVFGSFYVAAFIFSLLGGYEGNYFTTPMIAFSTGSNLDSAVGQSYWPNVLTTVAELNKSNLSSAIAQMGGKFFFFVAMVGILLMMLPRHKWKLRHWLMLGLGAIISLWLANNPVLGKFTILAVISLPVALVLVFYLIKDQHAKVAGALIVLVWFLATVYATYSGVRFILLMIPAYGIAIGVVAGRVHEWLTHWANKEFKTPKYVWSILIFVVIAGLMLTQPIKAGYGTAQGFVPSIDDGWWDTLTKIKQETSQDTIINSWWDFGHWFKYVAERRVSADGTTQGTHVPHWLGRALVTPDENEAVGILRMLDCGSDAYPAPEGDRGAYGKILAVVDDAITAQDMTRELTLRDKDDAADYLKDAGFSDEQVADVLESSHCEPPENILITSGDMVGKAGVWAHFGLWSFERAFLVEQAGLPENEAVQNIVDRFDYTPEEAAAAYIEVKSLRSEGEINAYVSPWPGYITSSWSGCRSEANSTDALCSLGIVIANQGAAQVAVDAFVYNSTNENESAFVFGTYQQGQRVQGNLVVPGRIVIADKDGLRELTIGESQSPNLAALYDAVNNRVLLADPVLVDAMFTQLFYLEGRYNTHFTLFDDRTTFAGSRILTWSVDWDG